MPKPRTSPPMGPVKIPANLRKQVAELAQERGCFQYRILSEALTEYFAKLEKAKAASA